jgi:hypothetical protein
MSDSEQEYKDLLSPTEREFIERRRVEGGQGFTIWRTKTNEEKFLDIVDKLAPPPLPEKTFSGLEAIKDMLSRPGAVYQFYEHGKLGPFYKVENNNLICADTLCKDERWAKSVKDFNGFFGQIFFKIS